MKTTRGRANHLIQVGLDGRPEPRAVISIMPRTAPPLACEGDRPDPFCWDLLDLFEPGQDDLHAMLVAAVADALVARYTEEYPR